MKGKHWTEWLLYTMLGVVAFILLARFRFLLLIAIGLGVLGILLYLSAQYLLDRRQEQAYARTTEGQFEQRIERCQEAVEDLTAEREDLQQRIEQLQQQLTPDLSPHLQQETESLIAGFRQELRLRETKIAFYGKLKEKLLLLLRQHRVQQALSENKKALEALQDKHYDDLADMESLRWDIERESLTLETIQELSHRMDNSHELDDALHLQKELEKMTREL